MQKKKERLKKEREKKQEKKIVECKNKKDNGHRGKKREKETGIRKERKKQG